MRHADADEEQAEQQALERFEIAIRARAGIRNRPAARRRGRRRAPTTCRRAASAMRVPDHHQQRGGGEHFDRIGFATNAEHRAQQVAPADHQRDDRADRAQRRRARSLTMLRSTTLASSGTIAISGIAARSWNSRMANAGRPYGVPSSLRSASICRPNRGRGQRQAAADDRAPPCQSRPSRIARQRQRHAARQHLQHAGAEHRAPHHPQPLRRQFQADHEQHQHDAEFGDRADALAYRRPAPVSCGPIATPASR